MTSTTSEPSPDCALSVVIVNWNTRDILHECLSSIARETALPHEVIVVDNASTDGSAEMVRSSHPHVTLITNVQNHGFAAANNQGLRIARGRKVLLLNPDTIVLDGAIDRIADWLDAHPDVGCVGCQVMEDETTIQRTSFADPGPLNLALVEFGIQRMAPRHRIFGRSEYGDWDRRSQRDVDVVSGMFMMVPRHVLDQVGLLDEAFFVYSEEADWCRRIRDAGWRCVFVPEARILHLDGGGKSTTQIRSRMHVQMQKSKMVYLRKHFGLPGVVAGRAIFLGSSLLRLLLAARRRNDKATAHRRLALASLRYHLMRLEPDS